ncbi:substrate-binding domain-containing protein [Uliginosibacterium gangwonense]|uniref:substrate-binding domain-containing protein n=1 Tax=Uliginosibacterium gangwonense TaxID=392736 RepID=UPI0003783436|nr:substrate-binding domain-containing protein [Uliginosibacterium gangwonense]
MCGIRGRAMAVVFACAAMCSGAVAARDCVGVISAGGGYAFWGEVERGARLAGTELGLDIYFRGPNDENSPYVQKDLISVVEKMRCKALVLAPNVSERRQEVAHLAAKDIPTVYIDRDFGNHDALAVIATNNYHMGEMAAHYMALALHGHGTVAVFHMKRGVPSTDERERGFVAGATAAGLSIVQEAWVGSGVGEARANIQGILPAFKVLPDGIFTPNESTTLATIYVLRQMDAAGKTKLIGVDINRLFVDAMHDEILYGVMVQRPIQMGYQGVMTAYQAALGRMPIQYSVDTGSFFVTLQNLNTPDFAEELAPFIKRVEP